MPKKEKQVTGKGYKKMNCKYCKSEVDRVDIKATAVTCFRCVNQLVDGVTLEIQQ
jgi:hypothetical protein